MSEVFGVDPDLTQFFEIPTIAGQARVLDESERSPFASVSGTHPVVRTQPALLLRHRGNRGRVPGNLGMHLAPDQPLYALTPTALLERQGGYTPERAAAEYIREIRAIQTEGPYFVGGWCAGAAVALEVARGLVSYDQDVALLVLFTPMLYPHLNHSLRSYWRSVSSLRVSERLPRILRTLRGLGSDLGAANRPALLTGSSTCFCSDSDVVQESLRDGSGDQSPRVFPPFAEGLCGSRGYFYHKR